MSKVARESSNYSDFAKFENKFAIKDIDNCNKFNFSNEKKFDKHFNKHVIKQGEFGNITKDKW